MLYCMYMVKRTRGFALMPLEKRREAQSKGGKLSHQRGKAHTWTREEAIIAGRRGGQAKVLKGLNKVRAERLATS
jgi:uncharacterized protein